MEFSLKELKKNEILPQFHTYIISAQNDLKKGFKILINGTNVGAISIIRNQALCTISDLGLDSNFASSKVTNALIDYLVFELPEITKFIIRKQTITPPALKCLLQFFEEDESGDFVYRKKRIAVTALKPSDGGLHLGHYFGNIKPLIDNQDNYQCCFIFADMQLLNTDLKYYDQAKRNNNVELMMRQLIALGVDVNKTKIYVESKLKENEFLSFIKICDFTTDARNNRIPYIKSVKNNKNGIENPIKMSIMNYPIMEVMDFYLTDADVMFSNMDNKACVEYANELFQKMHTAGLMKKKKIKLIHGAYEYLPGIDGSKMSKQNHNAIFFLDSYEEIQQKVNKMYTDPNRITSETPGDIRNNVVFKFLKLFLSETEYIELASKYEKGEIGDTQTKERLTAVLWQFIEKTQKGIKSIEDRTIKRILGDNHI